MHKQIAVVADSEYFLKAVDIFQGFYHVIVDLVARLYCTVSVKYWAQDG